MSERPPHVPDPCAVPTAELAPIVQRFVDQWKADHPDLDSSSGIPRGEMGHFAGNGAMTCAEEILSERTVQHGPHRVPRASIRNVLDRRRNYTELRTVDALLSAIGQEHAMQDGRLSIVPNPRAPRAIRASCCGGSLNGSGEIR